MKKATICKITNILNGLMATVLLLLFLYAFTLIDGLGLIFGDANRVISEASADSIVGGYQVLGGLGLGVLGILGSIVLFGIMALCVFVIICLVITLICGGVSLSRYKKLGVGNFKTDSILKLIIDGFLVILCISSITDDQLYWILVAIIPTIVTILSIISLLIKSN